MINALHMYLDDLIHILDTKFDELKNEKLTLELKEER